MVERSDVEVVAAAAIVTLKQSPIDSAPLFVFIALTTADDVGSATMREPEDEDEDEDEVEAALFATTDDQEVGVVVDDLTAAPVLGALGSGINGKLLVFAFLSVVF